ncbi:hypothetical protein NQ317_012040 [Molorchus minor]|uniref:Uncharacterized protein n=1 Tax=Molorchus minor TaxID=1323400 RepID=A0ABQ9JDA2_9CUCU|nr:hypothetical protein NQ317_012040 [Molorchus minor]
MPILQRTEV